MKKIISVILILFIASSLVLAEKPTTTDVSDPTPVDSETSEVATTNEGLPSGLFNALSNVKNENARERIQRNIDRFREKLQARLEKMEGVEVEEMDEETGAMTVKAKEQVKFFGFIKGKATKRFEVDAKGNVNERAPWYKLFYSEA